MTKKTLNVPTLTANQIAKKWNLSLATVKRLISAGEKVEKEHTTDITKANEIARDHIGERPDYYKKLHKLEKSKISMKEGISAGPEREVPIIGDLTGSSRKVMKVDEIKLPPKVKKAVATGMTLANLGTLAQVAGDAAEGRKDVDPKRGVVAAASTLPGAPGWAATGLNYTLKGFDKAKEHLKKRENIKEDLRKWFREKWVRYDTKGNIKGPCAREEGEGKPKCRPLSSARAMSKDERAKSARRKRREDPVADRPGKGGKPVMVRTEQTLLEKNVPTNPELWARAKAQAKAKFDVYPSAYANGWASKWYKSKGGGWKSAANESVDEACWDGYQAKGVKKKGNKMVPNCVPVEEGWASIGRPYDWAGDVNTKAKFYGKKPKATTTKGDEKDDTYKDSKQSGKVKFAKSVREELSLQDIAKRREAADSTKTKDVFNRMRTGTPKGVIDLSSKTPDQVNEISAELVGKVSNARFWQGKAPSKTLSRAIAKKFIESGKKLPKSQKEKLKEFWTPFLSPHHKHTAQLSKKKANKPDVILDPGGVKGKTVYEVVATAVPPTYQPAQTTIQRPAAQQVRGSIQAGQTKIPVRQITPTSRTSGVGTARLSQGGTSGGGYNTLKPTTTDVKRNISNRFNPSFGQQGTGAMKASSVKTSSSFSQGGGQVAQKMASSSPSQFISKMSDAGRQAAATVSKAAPTVSKVAGAALRAASGPAATAAAAVMSPTPAGAGEDEKKRQDTLKTYNPYKAQGRSVSDYEKQVLTPSKDKVNTTPGQGSTSNVETPKGGSISSPERVSAPTPPERPQYFSRGQAFGAARKEAGGGEGKFSYDSKSYQTNVSGEPYKPASQLKQTSLKEAKMNTKEIINEALDNILENNLVDMKENLMTVLQEKAMDKIEERKKEIAANYFGQE